ncbi:MAG: hypothetical protein KIT17_21990 [Rubrivivax sp.]|nr:hypothetical protein [Rubrivivax sp.]
MKTRKVKLFNGSTFTVPQGIQRIDSASTHGWQVRYQGTRFFSDGGPPDGSGAAKSLAAATRELLERIATMPAPVVLKRGPSARKASGLPVGISGPIVVQRGEDRVRSAVLSVLLPRFGGTPQLKSVYIGTENTYSLRKYRAALATAKALRAEAVADYEEAATRARRRSANALRKELAAASRNRRSS